MDLKTYTVSLIRSKIIDVSSFVVNQNGKWTLTKAFAGLAMNTVADNETDLYNRIAAGLVSQAQSGALKVAS